MGQIKNFKGYININYKTKRATVTAKPSKSNPYIVSMKYNINIELPDPVEFNLESKDIKIPEKQAKEMFIEDL
jgi:hypothetical protein